MNLGTEKWEKTRANFSRVQGDAARYAHGQAPGMPTACLLGGNNLIFQKTFVFRKSLQICGQAAAKAKAKACSQEQGSPSWECYQGQGMQQLRVGSQGHGMLACMHNFTLDD